VNKVENPMKNAFTLSLLVAVFMAGPAFASGDAAAGKAKSATCAACHGPDGNSTSPAFPRLAGQHPDYLVHALEAYKSGKRKNAIMNGMAAGLSEQDMEDLAAFFSSQKGLHTKY
jgi:cytochrome c553